MAGCIFLCRSYGHLRRSPLSGERFVDRTPEVRRDTGYARLALSGFCLALWCILRLQNLGA